MTKELTLIEAKQQLERFKPNFQEMTVKADSLVVDSKESQVQANDMIGSAKGLIKKLEGQKVSIYDILYPKENRDIMKEVNALLKEYKGIIDKIIKSLERKYLDYDAKLRREVAEAEAARLRAQEEAKKKAEEASLYIPPGMEVKTESMPPAPKVENVVSGDSSASYVKTVKSYEIVDFAKIPDSYKLLNVPEIRREMHRKDRQDIPGIKWTEESQLATRTKK